MVFVNQTYDMIINTQFHKKSFARVLFLFERSEFLIATCRKKETDRLSVCPDVRLILVLVLKNCLGFSVGYQRARGWF